MLCHVCLKLQNDSGEELWRCFFKHKLTKVRPLFTLLYRGSNNSPLLIVFSANYIDQSNVTSYKLCICIIGHDFDQPCRERILSAVQYFWRWQKSFYCYVFLSPRACILLRSKGQSFQHSFSHMKVTFDWSIYLALNTISNGELSDPLYK